MTRFAPYAEQHKSPQGPGDARPTASQVVEDQGMVSDPSWTGRVILITGCSPGGIGPETAKAMHLTGADVYITVRDMVKGAQVAEEILADGKPGKVEVIQMDLSSLESVRAGVDVFLLKSGNKLNVLINNAGKISTNQEVICGDFRTSLILFRRSHVLPLRQNSRRIRVTLRHQPSGYLSHIVALLAC